MGNGHFSVFYILFCVAVTSVYTVFRTQHTKYLCFLSLIPLFKKAPTLLYILLKKVIPSAIVWLHIESPEQKSHYFVSTPMFMCCSYD